MPRRILTVTALCALLVLSVLAAPTQAAKMPSRKAWLHDTVTALSGARALRRQPGRQGRHEAGAQPRHRQHLAAELLRPRQGDPGDPATGALREEQGHLHPVQHRPQRQHAQEDHRAAQGARASRSTASAPTTRASRWRRASSAAGSRSSTTASRSSRTSATGARTSPAGTTSAPTGCPTTATAWADCRAHRSASLPRMSNQAHVAERGWPRAAAPTHAPVMARGSHPGGSSTGGRDTRDGRSLEVFVKPCSPSKGGLVRGLSRGAGKGLTPDS